MRHIFLGPVWHWIAVVLLCGLGWFGGAAKMHVISFNLFLILMLVVTVIALVFVLATSAPGQRVTRDAIEDHEEP